MAHYREWLGQEDGVSTELILEDGDVVVRQHQECEPILDHVQRMGQHQFQPTPALGAQYVGSIPILLYQQWQSEWRATARKDGVPFNVFLLQKMKDRDFSRLSIDVKL